MKLVSIPFIYNSIYLFKVFAFALTLCVSCTPDDDTSDVVEPPTEEPPVNADPSFNKVESILFQLPTEDYVMVLAHRGGFESTPENSLEAIQHSTDIGVDIVEIDVQLSKDNHLVVMHDESINRTTNGIGLVSDYTLEELKQFKLLRPKGLTSDEYIPSLKEALEFSKGKMHLFIDKADDYVNYVYNDMLTTNTINQTLIGGTMTLSTYKFRYPDIWDKINYVPRAGTGQSLQYITDFENELNPIAYFPSCSLISSNNEVYQKIVELNKWNLSTTLKGSDCSEQSFEPETIWNWEIQQGTDGIFTDKSQELINFLTEKGLHNND